MPYDAKFYDDYLRYMREKSVRTSHDFVFEQFKNLADQTENGSGHVIDFGCGLGEYESYGPDCQYIGIDNSKYILRDFGYISGDYHDLKRIKQKLDLKLFHPTTFVSLFSIECFHSAGDKYDFYHRIFKKFPRIDSGLVGGFFYESKRNQETVGETGGIVSYQTIEDPSLHISDVFSELRLHIKTPSKMFGPDVVEVWKIFIRRV